MNKIYQKMYQQKIFSLDDASKIIKNRQVCKNSLRRLIKKQFIKRLRNNIYYIVPLDNQDFFPDRIEIAARLREDYFISCNTALQIILNMEIDNYIYISTKYSGKIRIKDTIYKFFKTRTDYNTMKIDYGQSEIYITELERTIIDCLWNRTTRIDRLIEILKEKKPAIDFSRLLNYLEKLKKQVLYSKAGFLLQVCKQQLDITDSDLERLKKKLGKKIFYAREKGLRLVKPRFRLYGKWNMMIPEELYEKVKASIPQEIGQQQTAQH